MSPYHTIEHSQVYQPGLTKNALCPVLAIIPKLSLHMLALTLRFRSIPIAKFNYALQ